MTSEEILDLVTAAIRGGGTDAKDRVYRTGDWPTQPDQYPLFKLRIANETKQSLGRGEPQFTVVTTVQILGEASEVGLPFGEGAAIVERKLWRLQRQAEIAVINSYPLFAEIQQLASVQAQLTFTSEAETHLAGIDIRMAFEFYQGPEDFAPIEADDVDEVDIVIPTPAASITIPTS